MFEDVCQTQATVQASNVKRLNYVSKVWAIAIWTEIFPSLRFSASWTIFVAPTFSGIFVLVHVKPQKFWEKRDKAYALSSIILIAKAIKYYVLPSTSKFYRLEVAQ